MPVGLVKFVLGNKIICVFPGQIVHTKIWIFLDINMFEVTFLKFENFAKTLQ